MLHTPFIRIRRGLCIGLVILGLVCLCAHSTPAQPPRSMNLESGNGKQPWVLQAESMQVFQKRKVVEATDNVLLTRGNNSLQADYARYYWDTDWVFLRGNIKVRFGPDTMEAKTAEFDLKNEVGWIKNGRVFLEGPHLYVTGDYVKKNGPQTYSFKQATVTACDGPQPDWSLAASRGTVTLDGYARLVHPRFRIKDHPVLYSPYMVLPAKKGRQSGVLMPELSSGNRNGLSLNLPYYQVIDPERDATVYANMMERRGVMLGLEYRTTPDLMSKGVFRADWLHDSLDDAQIDQFQNDAWQRPNSDRYWIRGKYNGKLFSPDWKTKLDVDLVSDQDYLRDFDSGMSGFETSREMFLSQFGRDIANKDDLTRTSLFQVSRNWSWIGLRSQMAYSQNLKYMNDNLPASRNPTLQRLPQINLDIFQHHLLSTPLQWRAQNEVTYFWRTYGTTGMRSDFHPQISLPYKTTYGTLIPRIGWRETVYSLDSLENSDLEGKTHTRGLFDAQISASTTLERVFQLGSGQGSGLNNPGDSRWTGIKHTVQPQLEWNYIPHKDQQDLPNFDDLDRIAPENDLTYSIHSVLTNRKVTLSPTGEEGEQTVKRTTYRAFCTFDLEQSYDFREAGRGENTDTYPRRPFTDVRAKLQLSPYPWLALTSTTWFSPYETTVTEHEHLLHLTYKDKSSFLFGLDYQNDMPNDIWRKDQEAINVLRIGASHRLTPSWRVGVDIKQDLENSKIIHQRLRVGYTHQCWGLDVEFERTENENRFMVLLNLLQIGQVGQSGM